MASAPRAAQEKEHEDWSFMVMWIENMRDRLSVYTPGGHGANSDAVRVGRDNVDDVWLRVDIDRFILEMHDDGEQRGLQEVKESVIMTHYMACVNYELWYEGVTEGDFTMPDWVLPVTTKIPLRYVFDFGVEFNAAFYDWEESLRFLLSHNSSSEEFENYSEEFRRDFPRLQRLMVKRGVALEDVESIEILFRSAARMSTAEQLQHLAIALRRLEPVDRHVAVEHGWACKVAALELELNEPFLHHEDVVALSGVLRLGIPVESLRLRALPRMKNIDSDVKPETFVKFLRILNGLVPYERGQLTQVRRLELGLEYYTMRSFGMFCSALASNPCLRELRLKLDEEEDNEDIYRQEHRHVWSWLSFALFRAASRNVMETLSLDLGDLKPSDVQAAKAVMESADPLAFLCSQFCYKLPSQIDSERSSEEVQLDRITTVTNGLKQTLLSEHWKSHLSELMSFDSSNQPLSSFRAMGIPISPTYGVFIPGLGFCEAKVPSLASTSDERPVKRRRIEATTPTTPSERALRKLKLKARRSSEVTLNALIELVRLLGPRLTDLGLEVEDLEGEKVDRIFASCPNLESFAAAEVHLESMAVFTRAYDTYNLPLSSLDLPCVGIHVAEFDAFIQCLGESNKMTKTLQKLRLGSMWSHDDPFWATTECFQVCSHQQPASLTLHHPRLERAV